MANASGCESVSGSRGRFCGKPLSVRKKSWAVSSKTTSPLLVFTRAGTSTRVERTVSAAGPGSVCCASAPTVKRQSRRGNVRADLITLGFIVDHPRLPQVLLGPQSVHWIDRRRAAGGQITGEIGGRDDAGGDH